MYMQNPLYDKQRLAALRAVAKLRRDNPPAYAALRELAKELYGNDEGSAKVSTVIKLGMIEEILN